MGATRYEFRVEGVLSDDARTAFAGMCVTEALPQTVIDGDVLDESHLHGIIAQLQSLGFTLVSAQPVPS
ncbi:MAG TPA: hypothetical protein VGE11_19690 [Pseudonocardia sp.]